MKTASRYKRHFKRNSEARTIRKAVSAEPLLDFSSDDEEDRTGGKDSSNGVYPFSSLCVFRILFPVIPFHSLGLRIRSAALLPRQPH